MTINNTEVPYAVFLCLPAHAVPTLLCLIGSDKTFAVCAERILNLTLILIICPGFSRLLSQCCLQLQVDI